MILDLIWKLCATDAARCSFLVALARYAHHASSKDLDDLFSVIITRDAARCFVSGKTN